MRYITVALCAALLLMGWLYRSASNELVEVKTELVVVQEANKASQGAINRLERSIAMTELVVAQWDKDRTTLAQIRNATQQAIKEAMHDEAFKTWTSSVVPAVVWGMFKPHTGNQTGDSATGSAVGAHGAMPTNTTAGTGLKR